MPEEFEHAVERAPARRGPARGPEEKPPETGGESTRAQAKEVLDSIVLIAMGDHAAHEASELNKAAPEGVKSIRQRGEQDTAKVDGKKVDLSTEEGASTLVKSIGVPDAKAKDLVDILLATGAEAKDEVAQVFIVFQQAETGDRSMKRLVLSGHSVGTSIWGDNNGDLEFDILKRITKAFPGAAGQVEDLMLSACYSGGEATMNQYFELFPGVKTIWAYHDSSPGSFSGAVPHMKKWERATRGQDYGAVDPELAKGTRKAKNISTWNEEDGYQGAERKPLATLIQEAEAARAIFDIHFSGGREVVDTGGGPLRGYYNIVQSTLAHPELSAAQRADFERRRDVTIRLIYFAVVRKKFAEHHQSAIASGYQKLGQPAPSYAKLSRKDTLTAVEAFRGGGGEAGLGGLLHNGLVELDPAVIPSTWV